MQKPKIKNQNHKLKFKIFTFCFVILPFAFCILNSFAYAKMSSDNYEIQMPNLNWAAGTGLSSTGYQLGFTGGELGVGPYSSTGFQVHAGFWYLKSIIPFGFTVTPLAIDFGTLTANSPVTKTITLTVSSGGAGGYQVTAQENKPLTSGAGSTIPDTTCDDGSCTENLAATWSQNSTYGFGYTLFGNDVPTPFPITGPAGSKFKQFSNLTLNEIPEPVMSSSLVGKNRSATIMTKINVSGTQPAGSYQNIITFIATPTY